jgi:RHS repeat-associated protein
VPDPENQGKFVRTDFYYTASWQLVEERQDDNLASKDTVASTLKYQYVWGSRYIDAPICRDEDTSGDGDCTDAKTDADPAQNTGDEHLYYCQDANFNVTALVDDYDGAVVERYMYSPYGQPEVLHGDRDSSGTDTSADEWSERTSNTFENALLYCGYYRDSETGLYHVRHRCLHATLGRWTSRDPVGHADWMNLYEYARSSPCLSTDAFGLLPSEEQFRRRMGDGIPEEQKKKALKQLRESYGGMVGESGPFLDKIKGLIPITEGKVKGRRTEWVIAQGTGWKFAVVAGVKGSVVCCRSGDATDGKMFVGSVSAGVKGAVGFKIGSTEDTVSLGVTAKKGPPPPCENDIDLVFEVTLSGGATAKKVGIEVGTVLAPCDAEKGCTWDLRPYVEYKTGSAGAEIGLTGSQSVEAKIIVKGSEAK